MNRNVSRVDYNISRFFTSTWGMAREVWCAPCVTGRGGEGGHRTDHAQGTGRRSLWLRRALHLTTATKAM